MVKPVIAIDLDDVLSANAEGFVAWSNQRFGTNLKPDEYSEHWAELWQVDLEEEERRAIEFHEMGIVAGFKPKDEALPVLRELAKNYKLLAVTSRRITVEGITREWIDTHFRGIFDDVKFSGIYGVDLTLERYARTKADLYSTNKVKFVIDDHVKHCIAAADQGIKALLFGDYPWNRTSDQLPALVTRVADWDGVRRYFDGQRG